MARCDEGYRCQVCGGDVESILDSDLYLAYILGEIPLHHLHTLSECHIRCNPARAQYIVDESFPSVECTSLFDKRSLDRDYVSQRENEVTRAWRRLQAIPRLGLSVPEYPLSVTPDH
ncbi:hypothetical protein [Tuwongella immobilis]|uniref:Uncharacterized protein n=1 Tax=Tuwongella immobilis TaxID=692036 RepID=A0A6C2YPB4_9BACT|nr:hypothetical protein [Tuwongella immobilis]VIP03286.1 Uncharacterized protein OS=Pirellula staleyi (strain ATCC 27377 / DSM 6068 / ICPB 4128) GN=Psta_1031 PE=4 SV=1 [Tuwongella immobilis]VTS03944.1 Uncharacterized protein OS=Pirellula staleyi (strain ATCC 27377 / DSM 6068 / ICPB 4128) GN=Psta_1031 PE=4 SV=1 [Tuwongella immobilis]